MPFTMPRTMYASQATQQGEAARYIYLGSSFIVIHDIKHNQITTSYLPNSVSSVRNTYTLNEYNLAHRAFLPQDDMATDGSATLTLRHVLIMRYHHPTCPPNREWSKLTRYLRYAMLRYSCCLLLFSPVAPY